MKIFPILILILTMIQSGHIFAHATTAELSWQVQNCDLIIIVYTIIFTRFGLRAHKRFVKQDPGTDNTTSPFVVTVWWSDNSENWVMVNSLCPSDTIWRHKIGSWLVQIMACHLFSAMPLPESALIFRPVGTNLSEPSDARPSTHKTFLIYCGFSLPTVTNQNDWWDLGKSQILRNLVTLSSVKLIPQALGEYLYPTCVPLFHWYRNGLSIVYQLQGPDVLKKNFSSPTTKFLHFFSTDYSWFRRKLCSNQLAQPSVLLVLGHGAVGWVHMWWDTMPKIIIMNISINLVCGLSTGLAPSHILNHFSKAPLS